MMQRDNLAIYYAGSSARYAAHAMDWRDRCAGYARLHPFWRWLIGSGWIAKVAEDQKTFATLAEAYALTSRYLRGLEE